MGLPKLQDIFLHAGHFYVRYPFVILGFTMACVLIAAGGIQHLQITNDPIELWVDPASEKLAQQKDKTSIFGEDFRIENLVFKLRESSAERKNLIQKEYLKEISYFQTVIMQSKVTVAGNDYALKDLCWKAFKNGDCVVQSPMNFWQNNLKRLEDDANVDSTVSCFKSVDPFNSIACMDSNKIPVVSEAVFGGIWKEALNPNQKGCRDSGLKTGLETSEQDKIFKRSILEKARLLSRPSAETSMSRLETPLGGLRESDPCGLFKTRAETLSLSVLLNNNASKAKVYETFEKEAIEDLIKEFNKSEDSQFFKKWIPDAEVFPLKLRITYMLQRTVNDELTEETRQNYIIVVISYALMFVYVSISLTKHWNSVGSSVLLSLGGLLYIIMAIFVTYCVCGLFSIKANLISLEVIPFLILAIGVDNMFLMWNSVLKVPTNDIQIKVPVGMRRVGLSILLSTFTQIATFIVGLYINIPALRSFCLIAAIALFCNFVFQMTALPALITLDLRRKRAGRWDLLPCVRSKKYKEKDLEKLLTNDQTTDCFYKMFEKCCTPMVMSIPCKIISLLVCAGLLILCVPALVQLPLGLDQQNTTLKNGNLYEYFGDLKNYLEIGPQGYIIFKDADWDDIDTYTAIDRLMDFLAQKEGLIASNFRVWYQGMFSLQDSQYTNPEMMKVCFKGLDPDDYIGDNSKLAAFYLTLDMNHPCCASFAICGGQFYEDVIFNREAKIQTTRIAFFHQRLRTQDDFISSMNNVFDVLNYFIDNMMENPDSLEMSLQSRKEDSSNQTNALAGESVTQNLSADKVVKDGKKYFSAYPYSLYYIFFDQYGVVKGITVQNYILALLFLFCFVSCLYSAFTSILLVFIVVLISSNLWSLMWLQNFVFPGLQIEFNAVLVVNLIIAIGFSVEFCIHLIVRFSKAQGNKRTRVKTALNEIGSLVFQGIFLTKLIGLSILYFSPIPLFELYYFRVYITMILICAFYGLVVAPQILEHLTPQEIVNRRSITEYFSLGTTNTRKKGLDPNDPETFNQGNLKSPQNEKVEEEEPKTEKVEEVPKEEERGEGEDTGGSGEEQIRDEKEEKLLDQ